MKGFQNASEYAPGRELMEESEAKPGSSWSFASFQLTRLHSDKICPVGLEDVVLRNERPLLFRGYKWSKLFTEREVITHLRLK